MFQGHCFVHFGQFRCKGMGKPVISLYDQITNRTGFLLRSSSPLWSKVVLSYSLEQTKMYFELSSILKSCDPRQSRSDAFYSKVYKKNYTVVHINTMLLIRCLQKGACHWELLHFLETNRGCKMQEKDFLRLRKSHIPCFGNVLSNVAHVIVKFSFLNHLQCRKSFHLRGLGAF